MSVISADADRSTGSPTTRMVYGALTSPRLPSVPVSPADERRDEAAEHYFSSSPAAGSRPRTVPLRRRGLDVMLRADRGVFSPGRIDPGTALLVDRAPVPPATGRFLDLGCGYGPIAVALATLAPAATVIAVDVNERALALTAANARALGLDNVSTAAPAQAEGPFDLIWSNPPIRIGKAALHDLLVHRLGQLAPDGAAVLVVNRHLGADSLHRWLEDGGHPVERVASRQGYRLLQVDAAA